VCGGRFSGRIIALLGQLAFLYRALSVSQCVLIVYEKQLLLQLAVLKKKFFIERWFKNVLIQITE
jgi:hypothetical protein